MHVTPELLAEKYFVVADRLPEAYKGFVLPGASVLTGHHPDKGRIIQQEFRNTHYAIRYHSFQVSQPCRLPMLQTAARLSSFLSLQNALDYDIDGVGQLQLQQGQFTLLRTEDRPSAVYLPRIQQYQSVEIAWADQWVESLLPVFQFLKELFRPLTRLDKGFFLYPKPRPAGGKVLDAANTILTSPYTADISRVFFGSKAKEYMMLLLIESGKKPHSLTRMTEEQRAVLIELGERIRKIVDQRLFIADLSREVGLNATLVKNGIKEIYGEPPITMNRLARLREGQRLLEEGTLSIKEIAHRTGYSGSPSFINSFKKEFGYNPSDARNKRTH